LSNVYAGVTTIAGGKSTRSGDMHDPSDDAWMFTNAEICYSSSRLTEKTKQCWRFSSSLMDWYQDEAGFPLGTFHLNPAIVLFTKEYCSYLKPNTDKLVVHEEKYQ
jgi:hypothetical protein